MADPTEKEKAIRHYLLRMAFCIACLEQLTGTDLLKPAREIVREVSHG
jgi:hypothetical protein